MQQPPPEMAPLRIVVGPMDDASFVIPFVLSAEDDRVASFEILDPWCHIDVVADQHGATRLQPHQETLVSRASEVIGEESGNDTLRFDDHPRALLSVQLLNISLGPSPLRIDLQGGPNTDSGEGQPTQSRSDSAPKSVHDPTIVSGTRGTFESLDSGNAILFARRDRCRVGMLSP